jgi:hypothetical protein
MAQLRRIGDALNIIRSRLRAILEKDGRIDDKGMINVVNIKPMPVEDSVTNVNVLGLTFIRELGLSCNGEIVIDRD